LYFVTHEEGSKVLNQKPFVRQFAQLILLWACCPFASAVGAEIVKVEEVWEMVVSEPDAATYSPQITFFTSPSTEIDANYFQLQLNYAADANFSPGGFHVAAISEDVVVDEARSSTRSILATANDRIRWTSVMAVIGNHLVFAVKDGVGQQWGAFGGPDYLVKITPSAVTNLQGYHPQQSLDAVDVGYGANRLDSITLIEVKCFYDDGRVVTVPVNRHPSN
jgi:hypothetical protein